MGFLVTLGKISYIGLVWKGDDWLMIAMSYTQNVIIHQNTSEKYKIHIHIAKIIDSHSYVNAFYNLVDIDI